MTAILTTIHIIVCLALIAIVLLQHGKGADMGAAFGGGASQTVFGTEGPLPLLNKITTGSAIIFMATSIALAYISAHSSKGTLMEELTPPPAQQTTTEPLTVPPSPSPAQESPASPAPATPPAGPNAQ